jgi:hypothetical protein
MPALALNRPRHHSRRSTLRNDLRQVAEVSARLGSLVTLAALLVVGGTLGGLADDGPATTGIPTVQATFGHR